MGIRGGLLVGVDPVGVVQQTMESDHQHCAIAKPSAQEVGIKMKMQNHTAATLCFSTVCDMLKYHYVLWSTDVHAETHASQTVVMVCGMWLACC